MKCLQLVVEYTSRSDEFHIPLISDMHLGNKHTDEKLITEIVERIRTDKQCPWWFNLGDMCEFISRRDWRFDQEELAPWARDVGDLPRVERQRLIKYLAPIANKCGALLEGNHEHQQYHKNDRDVYKTVAEALHEHVPADDRHELCMGHRGFVNIRFRRMKQATSLPETWTMTLFLTHGNGGGRKSGGKALRLEEISGYIEGVDVMAMGHVHTPQHIPLEKIRPTNGREARHTLIHTIVVPGLCRDPRYADEKDLRPVPIGYTNLVVTPDKRNIKVEMLIS